MHWAWRMEQSQTSCEPLESQSAGGSERCRSRDERLLVLADIPHLSMAQGQMQGDLSGKRAEESIRVRDVVQVGLGESCDSVMTAVGAGHRNICPDGSKIS